MHALEHTLQHSLLHGLILIFPSGVELRRARKKKQVHRVSKAFIALSPSSWGQINKLFFRHFFSREMGPFEKIVA